MRWEPPVRCLSMPAPSPQHMRRVAAAGHRAVDRGHERPANTTMSTNALPKPDDPAEGRVTAHNQSTMLGQSDTDLTTNSLSVAFATWPNRMPCETCPHEQDIGTMRQIMRQIT